MNTCLGTWKHAIRNTETWKNILIKFQAWQIEYELSISRCFSNECTTWQKVLGTRKPINQAYTNINNNYLLYFIIQIHCLPSYAMFPSPSSSPWRFFATIAPLCLPWSPSYLFTISWGTSNYINIQYLDDLFIDYIHNLKCSGYGATYEVITSFVRSLFIIIKAYMKP